MTTLRWGETFPRCCQQKHCSLYTHHCFHGLLEPSKFSFIYVKIYEYENFNLVKQTTEGLADNLSVKKFVLLQLK